MGFLSALFGDTPTPPNPLATAQAQSASNFGTAIASGYMNNVNQQTPAGNLTYTPDYTTGFKDPLSGYTVPTWTAKQTYTPEGQKAFEAQQRTGANLAQMGEAESSRLGSLLGTDFDANFNASAFLQANPDLVREFNANWGTGGDPAKLAAAARYWYQNAGMQAGHTQGVAGQQASTDLLRTPDALTGFGDVGGQQRGLGPYGQQLTGFGDAGSQQTGFGDVGNQQYGFDAAGNITRGYGPQDNFSADRGRVEEALFRRMDPQLQQDRDRLRQQLADQGIRYGSEAYNNAIAQADRQTTDARLAVTAAGGAEQQRMMEMAAQEAGFENAAQQQAYNQAMGRGQFANTAQQAAYQQALGRGTFANTAQEAAFKQAQARGQFTNQAQLEQFQKDLQAGNFANEAQKNAFTQEATRAQFTNAGQAQNLARNKALFDAQNANRAQYLQENYAQRQQPINEISALQSGSQVQQPNFVGTANQSIANTDVAGIINSNFSQNLDIYKQNSSNLNNIIGGLFGLAGAGVKASDRRVKKNIAKLGNVYMADRHDAPKKLPVYSYEYKGSDTPQVGPMAQDVERIDPQAVVEISGVKHLKKQRVMGDILKVA